MTNKVVVDSDALYAIYNYNDPLHDKAIKTLQWLNNYHYRLIYPTSVIFEVMSLFQRVLSSPSVIMEITDMIHRDVLVIYPIDNELLKESADIFNPTGSKKNTLIDCSVVIVAKKVGASGVFSYDGFYTKQGLKLAEEIVGSLR